MKRITYLACIIFIAQSALAQTALPVPTNINNAYAKQTRSSTGKPGDHYWQNTAVYNIDVTFNPATRKISGKASIVYTNNSPEVLNEIVFKLYPNLYQKGAPRLSSIKPEDISDGISIQKILADDMLISKDSYKMDATNMTVNIKPLKPKQSIRFSIPYSYTLNKNSHIRTGQVDEGAFFIAYFFPRIAVYDDIDGWNMNPYLGTQEFYNDFCDFNLNISVPAKYIVWATGDQTNSAEIFKQKYIERIKQAETQNEIISIIDNADLKAGAITKSSGANTWKFTAKNVTDAVFAISNHYLWQSSSLIVDSASGRRTRVDAVFNGQHEDYFNVASDARKTVEAMSFRFPKWPFPYNHETIFDGLDQMEYPMMVNDNPVADRAESIELTDHEIFHTMFPFYMGINETKYGWMDEGWATIGEWLISPMIDSSIVDGYGVARYESVAGSEIDLPVTTLTTQLFGPSMFINSYPKPGMGYLYVKDMLGDELFYKALHHYIRNWNCKHPMPYDFFNSMNEGCGQNLNWFWKRWFFDNGVPDLAIVNASQNGNQKQVIIKSIGAKPLPVDLQVFYTDGSMEIIHRSIAVWQNDEKETEINFTSAKQIEKLVLGSTHVPDVNKADNIFVMPH